MADSGEEAVVEETSEGVITAWDEAAEALFGWPRTEAVGMRSEELIPARNRPRHAAMLRSFVEAAQHGVFRRAVTAHHRDGHEFPIAIVVSLVGAGGAVRVVTRARAPGADALPAMRRVGSRDARYLAIRS